jgi:hypothetical protein
MPISKLHTPKIHMVTELSLTPPFLFCWRSDQLFWLAASTFLLLGTITNYERREYVFSSRAHPLARATSLVCAHPVPLRVVRKTKKRREAWLSHANSIITIVWRESAEGAKIVCNPIWLSGSLTRTGGWLTVVSSFSFIIGGGFSGGGPNA